MHGALLNRPVHAHLRPCLGRTPFRQAIQRPVSSHRPRSRPQRVCARATATKEDVEEVQESSNAGRKIDPNPGELMSWEQIGESAGTDVLKGYQLLDQSPNVGQPRTAPTRVLPAEESTTTDKPVLLYRDTNAWCPFCERVRTTPAASLQA